MLLQNIEKTKRERERERDRESWFINVQSASVEMGPKQLILRLYYLKDDGRFVNEREGFKLLIIFHFWQGCNPSKIFLSFSLSVSTSFNLFLSFSISSYRFLSFSISSYLFLSLPIFFFRFLSLPLYISTSCIRFYLYLFLFVFLHTFLNILSFLSLPRRCLTLTYFHTMFALSKSNLIKLSFSLQVHTHTHTTCHCPKQHHTFYFNLS